MGLVNEKELGESIATNLAPKLEAVQSRLEDWAETFLQRLLTGNLIVFTLSLGGQTVAVTVEVVPKP